MFAVAHEADSCSRLFREVYESLNEDGKILFAEPAKHVSKELFDREIESALQNGFLIEKTVQIPMSQAVLLSKSH